MLKKLIILALLPLIVYLGAKTLMHYRIGQSMDMVVQQLAPMAELQYESVTSSMDGKVGLSGITVQPSGIDDKVEIDEIFIQFPGFMYLWNLEEHINKQDLPQELEMVVSGFRLSAYGEIARMSNELNEAELATTSCTTQFGSSSVAWSKLGYDELHADMSMGYTMASEENELRLYGTQNHKDARNVAFEIVFPLASKSLQGIALSLSDPTLLRAEVNIEDHGFYDRIYDYCEKSNGLGADQVTEALVADLITETAEYGILPDERILKDYRQFLQGGDKIRISSRPFDPQKFSYMSLYDPSDMPDLLNIVTEIL